MFSRKVAPPKFVCPRSDLRSNGRQIAQACSYLRKKGIRLYRHQIEARAALREGKDIVIATPTASGKTLAFKYPF